MQELQIRKIKNQEAIAAEFKRFWQHYYGTQKTTLDYGNCLNFLDFISNSRYALQALKDMKLIEVWNGDFEPQIVRLWEDA